ncbi:MAG: beta-ketoacyl-ACP synthase II [Chloroflexota bacterium]|nr:beta-ketoacyl-ACP synthase II [Chloroflexota bacterium]
MVVTGIGMVTPLGVDALSTWNALVAGQSGVGYITQYDPSITETKIAAEVKGFDPSQYLDRKELRHMDRFVQFAVVSALQAVEHAGLKSLNLEEAGTIIGVGLGGLNTLLSQYQIMMDRGAERISPFLIPMMIPDMASGQVSITLGAKGPNFCTVSACASGSDAIGTSFEVIKRGKAQVMITGGAESVITPIAIGGFNAARALSTRNDEPQRASRPFDAERDGFIVGEGAAVLILESLAHAEGRGATILAELAGYGSTSDAYHITQPADGGEGGARAMSAALREVGLEPGQIDYINAHGTSTQLNDKNETAAIKTVFGTDAYRIPVSSTKSMTGHLLGAAGGVEAAVCVLAIRNGVVPPTTNYTTPDPDCDLDYVPNEARKMPVSSVLSNVFGFGGHNSTLIFRRYED